jgi:hypothetical protein
MLKTKNPGRNRGSITDHFGASPVASASGIRKGATPFGLIHPNTRSRNRLLSQDISTWQEAGHFYLALTCGASNRVRREPGGGIPPGGFASYWLNATPAKPETPIGLDVAASVRSPYWSIEKTAT